MQSDKGKLMKLYKAVTGLKERAVSQSPYFDCSLTKHERRLSNSTWCEQAFPLLCEFDCCWKLRRILTHVSTVSLLSSL